MRDTFLPFSPIAHNLDPLVAEALRFMKQGETATIWRKLSEGDLGFCMCGFVVLVCVRGVCVCVRARLCVS